MEEVEREAPPRSPMRRSSGREDSGARPSHRRAIWSPHPPVATRPRSRELRPSMPWFDTAVLPAGARTTTRALPCLASRIPDPASPDAPVPSYPSRSSSRGLMPIPAAVLVAAELWPPPSWPPVHPAPHSSSPAQLRVEPRAAACEAHVPSPAQAACIARHPWACSAGWLPASQQCFSLTSI
jgi:hypothetical protein